MATGMPLSMRVAFTPSTSSTTLPVGSSVGATDPAVSRKSMTSRAAVPGTPAIAVVPAYSTCPPGVGTWTTATAPVLTIWIRTGVTPPVGTMRFRSIANGPTPARMLPHGCSALTTGRVDLHL